MKKTLLFLAFAAAVLFASCSKDNDSPNEASGGDNEPAANESNLVAITHADSYEPEDMASMVGYSRLMHHYMDNNAVSLAVFEKVYAGITAARLYAMDTGFAGRKVLVGYKRNWKIESFSFTYRTTSVSGKPIVLSGRVSFPNVTSGTGHEVKSLSLATHFLLHGVDQAPSIDPSPFLMRTFYNSAVIEPDYEGYGVDVTHTFPGFSYEAHAVQMADCIRAALQIMASRNVTLAANGYSTAWGNSLATPSVVAFVKHYDLNMSEAERQQIRLKSAFVGCGPLLMGNMLEYLDQHPEFDASGMCYMPSFLNPLPQEQFGGFQLKEFFPEWMQTHKINVDGEEMIYYDAVILNKMTWYDLPEGMRVDDLHTFFAPDMFDADGHLDHGNAKVKTLFDIIERQVNWDNWTPQEDLYMLHCPDDNYIPYQQAEAFYQSKQNAITFHFKQVNSKIFGALFEAHGASTAVCLLNSLMYEDPAAAYKHASDL